MFRQRDLEAKAERHRRELKDKIHRSEMSIAKRLLREEDEYKVQRLARQREEAYLDRFRKEMGREAREARVQQYMMEHTRDQVDLLDPTSRKPFFPSEVMDVKTWAFGLGQSDLRTTMKVAQDPKAPYLYDAKPINLMLPQRYVLARKAEEAAEQEGTTVEVEKDKVASDDEDQPKKSVVPDGVDGEAVVARAEFQGTWEQAEEGAKGPRRYQPRLTVWEKRRMAEAHERHKSNITGRQVVMGREFHGPAFEPTPKVVAFRDFEVGKSYSQRVVLTNISWSKCSVRVLELPVDVRNCLAVQYIPSGQLSAGMTCSLTVVFEPKVNQDVRTHIPLLSSIGPLFIPVECTTKKANVKLSAQELVFMEQGQQAITLGESASRTIWVINGGALPVEFTVEPVSVNVAEHDHAPDRSVLFKSETMVRLVHTGSLFVLRPGLVVEEVQPTRRCPPLFMAPLRQRRPRTRRARPRRRKRIAPIGAPRRSSRPLGGDRRPSRPPYLWMIWKSRRRCGPSLLRQGWMSPRSTGPAPSRATPAVRSR